MVDAISALITQEELVIDHAKQIHVLQIKSWGKMDTALHALNIQGDKIQELVHQTHVTPTLL